MKRDNKRFCAVKHQTVSHKLSHFLLWDSNLGPTRYVSVQNIKNKKSSIISYSSIILSVISWSNDNDLVFCDTFNII